MARRPNRFVASVAICTRDRYHLLRKAVDSVQAQSLHSGSFEIIVVDNSSDAARSKREAGRYETVPFFSWHHEPTSGLSAARNRALAEARGEVIAFIDDDAHAHDGWLEAATDAVVDSPNVALVGGKVLPDWDGPLPPWLHEDLYEYLSVFYPRRRRRALRSGEWIVGTNMAFRTAALRELGGFDTSLGRKGSSDLALLSNEELEIVRRITSEGYTAFYEPAMVVSHLVPTGRLTQTWFRRRIVWQAISDYLMDPIGQATRAPEKWYDVVNFLASLPPAHRNPRGFYVEQVSASDFRRQLHALYCYTLNSLSGFARLEEDASLSRH